MTLEERLRTWYEALPDGGQVVLDRQAIGKLIGLYASDSAANPSTADRDYTSDEVARIFGVTSGTILSWLHAGRLGAQGGGWYRLGRRYYIRRQALSEVGSQEFQTKGVLRIQRTARRG